MLSTLLEIRYKEPTSLAKFLHSLPHTTFSFEHFDPNPDSVVTRPSEYAQSIAFLAVIPFLLFFTWILVDTILRCRKAYSKDGHLPEELSYQGYYFRYTFCLLLGMIGVGSLSVGMYENVNINRVVRDTVNFMGHAQQYNSGWREYGVSFMKLSADSADAAMKILSDPEMISQKDNVDQVVEDTTMVSETGQLLRDVTPGVNVSILSARVQGANRYRSSFFFTLFGIIIIMIIVNIMSPRWFENRPVFLLIQIVGVTVLTLSCLTFCFQFFMTVAASDICMEPENYLRRWTQETLEKQNPTAAYMLEHYITCRPEDRNPLKDSVANASIAVTQGRGAVNSIGTFVVARAKGSTIQEFEKLNYSYSDLQEDVLYAKEHISCAPIHQDLVNTEFIVCNKGIMALFTLIMFQGTAIICSLCIRCWIPVNAVIKHRHTYQRVPVAEVGFAGRARNAPDDVKVA